ncbi:MAG: prepilin-type N-terminal cleavage/methylation domain-containing protein [Firmicutes bacterium]|nr:prepilin-type N-terminal cleavage/methylation domain-containing protein [Bacillota bacterium]
MKKKGFTLIELLAVIVILAIIALIAVPVIMNIIASARKSAFEDTAYGLISAGEMYYARELLENGMTSDVEFTIEDGEFVGENKLEVKGSLPPSGSIKVTRDGKVALAISNGAMCITKGYDDSKIDPEADLDNCELPAELAKTLSELAKINDFAESVDACATSGTCAPGTKFVIEVAPENIQNFYVVSDVDNKVTLIMDRNVDEETLPWINNSDFLEAGGDQKDWNNYENMNVYGPITALNYLETQTGGWTNIAAKGYTLTDSVYGTMTRQNARARMLTITEALSVGCQENNTGCPTWLYGNFGTSNPPYGYWLSSASKICSYGAWYVDTTGSVYDIDSLATDERLGVRPVIEISK